MGCLREPGVWRGQDAVHLLGSRYGVVPQGEDASVVQLQCGEASTVAPRVLSIGPGTASPEPRMTAWLEQLRSHPPAGADLLEKQSVETLKALVLERLQPPPKALPVAPAAAGSASAVRIYLVCDRHDSGTLAPLVDRLFEAGYEVRLPLFDGDAEAIRQDHVESLREADGVLLWWVQGSEGWVRAMLRDCGKVFGLGRQQPFAARLLTLGAPATEAKERLRTRELPVVAGANPGGDGWLPDFLAALPAPPAP